MKKQLILVISLVVANVSFAQGNPTSKKEHRQKQEQIKEQSAISIPKAKGPTSFGAVKIGMAKEAIEALQVSDGVYLAAPMTTYASKYDTPREGSGMFNASLSTPLSSKPMRAVLGFKADRLTYLHFDFSESITDFQRVAAQISEKYGPGIIDDNRKEEQCIYKNGANFKITSGKVLSTWSENISNSERIETQISDVSIEICPSNLRNESVGGIQMRTITIQKLTNTSNEKPKNLF
jgi:hypothetical protein